MSFATERAEKLTTMAMAAVEDDGGGDRYSYAELKEAQRQCEARAVETAMMECGSTSKALQEVRGKSQNEMRKGRMWTDLGVGYVCV